MNSHFKDLLKLFNDSQVKYLIVGGYAVGHHSEPRYTKDIDLWVETGPENARRVFNALKEFGAPLKDLSSEDFTQCGYFYSMGIPPTRVDVMMSIKGVSFEDAWPRRIESEIEGERVSFISREDLIEAKRAAGRPQDLLDVDLLEQSRAFSEMHVDLAEHGRDDDPGPEQ